ncbi:c-type cytochrome [Fimbriiglobus ruber]|uniref:Cytochrome oxidase (Cbb3-type) n=1 Tax=Fimbriiglobus ruber TaxID=1908690 RepID=A0A225DFL1_9BACT|nr:c-type cytochrome [Fimbriiglobus ruber]OWK40330.1 cytochrome oxidase (cbb3-type) [Fimbriiglobus ruber]
MPRFGFPAFIAAMAFLAPPAAAQNVTRADLKPGLLFTTYEVSGKRVAASVARVEPTVALTLAAGEAAHPRSAGGNEFVWTGTINILQAGKYKFDANLAGTLSVRVGDQEVLANSVPGPEAKKIEGKEVQLAAGFQLITATLTRTSPVARVELIWRGPGFRAEPVPYFFFGHLPKQRPNEFKTDVAREHGRFLFEELSCVRCHRPAADDKMAATLVDRTGPNLTEVGKRAFPGWLDAWLADPAKLRPNTVMPKMFADDATGAAERYAVVTYLSSLGGPPVEPRTVPNGLQKSLADGQKLYITTGCAACHGDKLTQPPTKKKKDDDEDDKPVFQPEDLFNSAGTAGPQGFYLLGSLGSKTTAEALAKYLQNPLATNPHGRMPNMTLSGQEAQDLARFLTRQKDEKVAKGLPAEPDLTPTTIAKSVFEALKATPAETAAFAKLKPADQWKDLGKKLLTTKGCVNCHAVEPGGKALPVLTSAPALAKLAQPKAAGGCVAAAPEAGKVPVYKLDAAQKAALVQFLTDGLAGAGSPAPAFQARVAFKRFNCLNCHKRDGEGGFDEALSNQMKALEKAENADDVSPPRLTGAGHKLRTPWFKDVLIHAGRARPWMSLRMPQYGDANVAFIPEAMPKLEGTTPDDVVGKSELTAAKVEAGRTLAGKNGLGCIACHDISGITGGGTRGPDLALTNQRVRYDWYVRWMHQPQRSAPGTRMPQNFIDGKALFTAVYNGDGDAQIDALWTYFSLGQGLPLPSGMEPPKGLVIAVKDRPELLRTFMPDGAGEKAIAVGFPGGTNAVFDAATCRFSYAWSGNFLDASPVWNNRGGAPAKLLGPKFWTAPSAFPWAVTDSRTPPDFAKRATDPAYGHPLPNDEFYGGPRFVHFAGYTLDAAGVPTFRYELTGPDDKTQLAVRERAEPLPVTVASGLSRKFTADVPAGKTTWLLVGTATKDPRVYSTTTGEKTPIDLKAVDPEAPAVGTRLVVPTDGDRATVFELTAAPEGTVWRFVPKTGGGTTVLLRLPEVAAAGRAEVSLSTWGLPRDDEELLKGLKVSGGK